MTTTISALLLAALIWWFGFGPGKGTSDRMSPFTKRLMGMGAAALAIVVAVRGRMDLAVVLGSLAAWLWGVRAMAPQFGNPFANPFAERGVKFRTAMLDLAIDPATQAINGRVRSGALAGRGLPSLSPEELTRLAAALMQAGDVTGLGLIEPELDRRAPGWRQHVQLNPNARPNGRPGAGVMPLQEAYKILGLQPGAGEEAIRAAHRALIGKIHPDRGGSDHLAALVNQAKDILLTARVRGHG